MIYIFATQREAAPFRRLIPSARVVICGVGMAECGATIASLLPLGGDDTLVLAGVAGSYELSEVTLCEVVEVVSERIASLPERFGAQYRTAQSTSLRAVSSNTVNASSTESSYPTPPTQIENMEGAAFEAICQRLGINHIHIRAISNRVGDPFDRWRLDDACEALALALQAECHRQ